MSSNQKSLVKFSGLVGAWCCVILFVIEPSFPTPDKILIFLTFIFIAFSRAQAMLKRLLPFVAILLVYESFRGIADHLNSHVNYSLMPDFDKAVFGKLPTAYLQEHLWHGRVSWYDYVFYAPYLLHFVLPIGLALIIWKTRVKQYWQFVCSFLVVSYMGFLTFLIFPASPPWMASKLHYIQPIHRISSDVWHSLGLTDFPSFYSRISPNPVAAVPSLHAAWSTLFCIFVFRLFGRRWGIVSLIYPVLICVGTIYQGEHYAFDALAGILYAVIAYLATPRLMNLSTRFYRRFNPKSRKPKVMLTSSTRSALKSAPE